MSFGTKRTQVAPKPMVLATQRSLHVPKNDQIIQMPDLVAESRARYFANADAFSSTRALPRLHEPSELSKVVTFVLSTLAIAMCVFGVYYWLTGGTLKLGDL
jgi:hypothetical protein